MKDFQIPVGERNGIVLLENDAARFQKARENVATERYRAKTEAKAREKMQQYIQFAQRKSTFQSRALFNAVMGGKSCAQAAREMGIPYQEALWMVHRERVCQ